MNAQSKSVPDLVSVQLWVPPDLREGFKEAVKRDDLTVAQDLRRYMRDRVEQAELERAA